MAAVTFAHPVPVAESVQIALLVLDKVTKSSATSGSTDHATAVMAAPASWIVAFMLMLPGRIPASSRTSSSSRSGFEGVSSDKAASLIPMADNVMPELRLSDFVSGWNKVTSSSCRACGCASILLCGAEAACSSVSVREAGGKTVTIQAILAVDELAKTSAVPGTHAVPFPLSLTLRTVRLSDDQVNDPPPAASAKSKGSSTNRVSVETGMRS